MKNNRSKDSSKKSTEAIFNTSNSTYPEKETEAIPAPQNSTEPTSIACRLEELHRLLGQYNGDELKRLELGKTNLDRALEAGKHLHQLQRMLGPEFWKVVEKEFLKKSRRTFELWMQITKPENLPKVEAARVENKNLTVDDARRLVSGKEPKRKPSNAERKDRELADALKKIVADAYPTFRPDELERLHPQFVSSGSSLSDDFKAWMDVLMTELGLRARQQNRQLTKEDILKGREQATVGLKKALLEQRNNMRAG